MQPRRVVLLDDVAEALLAAGPAARLGAANVLNCYVVETVQKPVLRTNSSPTTDDVRFYQTYSRRVCGPPFAWDLPPDPDPGTVQFFCVRAVDTSNNFSDCGDITFVP